MSGIEDRMTGTGRSVYAYEPDRWYPTTPAEFGRMLREEAERRHEQDMMSFHYGELPSVHELAERVTREYETRQGASGMEYRRKPVAASW